MIDYINSWFAKYKNYLLVYKNGFWDIPYLSNSPETIIHSIIKMPFTSHSVKTQLIQSKTPLIKGIMYYEQIEEGLYIIQSEMTYKSNINYRSVHNPNVNSGWYMLSLTICEVEQKNAIIDGIVYTNATWLLFKPNALTNNMHFKGNHELSFTFYFNEDWLKRWLCSKQEFANNSIHYFFESEDKYIMCPGEPDTIKPLYYKIFQNFHQSTSRTGEKKNELKDDSYNLIRQFLKESGKMYIDSNFFILSDKARKIVYKTEKLLLENLTYSFPGIKELSLQAGISETYLKEKFKMVFGKTIFQYFQEKQMMMARELLMREHISITELSANMGYENMSKFSNAFKKHFGYLPSKLIRKG